MNRCQLKYGRGVNKSFFALVCILATLVCVSAETRVVLDGSRVLRSGSEVTVIATIFNNATSSIKLEKIVVYNNLSSIIEDFNANELLSNSSYSHAFHIDINKIKNLPQLWDNLAIIVSAVTVEDNTQNTINESHIVHIQPVFKTPNPTTGQQAAVRTIGIY